MYEIQSENRFKMVRLPQYFWHGREPLDLKFPEYWDVTICNMQGDNRATLSDREINEKIQRPIESPSIAKIADGKKEVAIVIDDLARPTEGTKIVPHLLAELKKAGIQNDQIRFLIALGSHGAHSSEDFRKKLGVDVVESFAVYNHNCYENCVEIGETRSGMKVKVNAELMECDLKIGIGAILPHPYIGFSGGGKLFMPGMAHIDTIDAFHSFTIPGESGKANAENPMIRETEDAIELIGVDFKVDVLVNTEGQVVDMYAGKPMSAYREAISAAKNVYRTPIRERFDIVVSNAHLKVNEGDLALLTAFNALKSKGGKCVLILNSPTGQMTHYLMRRFGKFVGGRQAVLRAKLPTETDVIVYSKFKDLTTFDPFEDKERIVWERDWSQVIERLESKHAGSFNVGIIPDGTIQYIQKSDANIR